MKIICMIPARIGSKRIKKKNLRLINNKPLISYIIEKAKKCKLFNEIYLNSDSIIFEKIAKKYGINFYLRDKKLASDKSTNDEFTSDFMQKITGDIIIQILPTSPLISSNEIYDFTMFMIKNKYETLISVENKQIACLYKNKPINFDKLKHNPPSQTMEPVKVYACVLMGWKYSSFKNNIHKYGSAYHGGKGKVGYFELKGLSTIDIDTEEDFKLAEKIIIANQTNMKFKIKYIK